MYCLFGRFSVSPMGKAVAAVAAKGSKATPKNARVPTDITTELVVSCAAVVALLFLPLVAIIPYVRAKGPSCETRIATVCRYWINVVITASTIVFCGSHLGLRMFLKQVDGKAETKVRPVSGLLGGCHFG
jgi:hypothetical protein